MSQNMDDTGFVELYAVDKFVQATVEDASLLRSVHPLAARMLERLGEKPHVRVPLVGLVLSDASMIREVFMDKVRFTKNGAGASSSFWNPIVGETGLLNMDGLDHMRLKRVLAPVFSRGSMDGVLGRMDKDLGALFGRLRDGEIVDVSAETALLSLKMTWRLIGFSEESLRKVDVLKLVHDMRAVTHGVNPLQKRMPAKRVSAARANLALVESITAEHHSSRSYAADSVMSLMVEEGYSLEDITTMVDVLMIAGTETLNTFVPRMVALFIRTGTFKTLADSPEMIPGAVDEALRVTVPTPVAVRVALEDCMLQGVQVRKGDRVVLNSFMACRALGPFQPGREIGRDVRGLWFGAGAHMCIGLAAALELSKRLVEGLTEVQVSRDKEYRIEAAVKAVTGHTGAYERLEIR